MPLDPLGKAAQSLMTSQRPTPQEAENSGYDYAQLLELGREAQMRNPKLQGLEDAQLVNIMGDTMKSGTKSAAKDTLKQMSEDAEMERKALESGKFVPVDEAAKAAEEAMDWEDFRISEGYPLDATDEELNREITAEQLGPSPAPYEASPQEQAEAQAAATDPMSMEEIAQRAMIEQLIDTPEKREARLLKAIAAMGDFAAGDENQTSSKVAEALYGEGGGKAGSGLGKMLAMQRAGGIDDRHGERRMAELEKDQYAFNERTVKPLDKTLASMATAQDALASGELARINSVRPAIAKAFGDAGNIAKTEQEQAVFQTFYNKFEDIFTKFDIGDGRLSGPGRKAAMDNLAAMKDAMFDIAMKNANRRSEELSASELGRKYGAGAKRINQTLVNSLNAKKLEADRRVKSFYKDYEKETKASATKKQKKSSIGNGSNPLLRPEYLGE